MKRISFGLVQFEYCWNCFYLKWFYNSFSMKPHNKEIKDCNLYWVVYLSHKIYMAHFFELNLEWKKEQRQSKRENWGNDQKFVKCNICCIYFRKNYVYRMKIDFEVFTIIQLNNENYNVSQLMRCYIKEIVGLTIDKLMMVSSDLLLGNA